MRVGFRFATALVRFPGCALCSSSVCLKASWCEVGYYFARNLVLSACTPRPKNFPSHGTASAKATAEPGYIKTPRLRDENHCLMIYEHCREGFVLTRPTSASRFCVWTRLSQSRPNLSAPESSTPLKLPNYCSTRQPFGTLPNFPLPLSEPCIDLASNALRRLALRAEARLGCCERRQSSLRKKFNVAVS